MNEATAEATNHPISHPDHHPSGPSPQVSEPATLRARKCGTSQVWTRTGSRSPAPRMRSPPASVTPRPFPPADLDDLHDDLAAEITYRRHLVPQRPPRSYTRSQKRPGGHFATKKPADPSSPSPPNHGHLLDPPPTSLN